MKKIIFIVVALLSLGCEKSVAPPESEPLAIVEDFSEFRDFVLDSLEIEIALLKNGDTIYSHRETSDGMTRTTGSETNPWYEEFQITTLTKDWSLSVSFDTVNHTVHLYSGIGRMEYGEDIIVRGLELQYDETTKTGIANLNDQTGMLGHYLSDKWTFYKTGPGDPERTDSYAGMVDSTTILHARARMRFR